MRLLDLFCGRWGWSRAFAARGWECTGIDLVEPAEIPNHCTFVKVDILQIKEIHYIVQPFDFIVASSPCEEFSVHGMKHFHPNPKYPEMGIKLFNHTRALCEASEVPYVMENVRPAQKFVGRASHHCGPFFLWGSGVPPLMPQGISKTKWTMHKDGRPGNWCPEFYIDKRERAAKLATIPPELANCVAEYAERLTESRTVVQ